jgi:hypothetical protein
LVVYEMMAPPVLWLAPVQSLEGVRPEVRRRSGRERPLARDRFELAAHAVVSGWERRPPEAAERSGPERHIEYDDYFGVRRISSEEPRSALADAAVVAYHRVGEDSRRGHSLTAAQSADLAAGFELTWSLAGRDPAAIAAIPAPEPAGLAVDALLRWKIGHHLFFVLIQALLLTHNQLQQALAARDLPAAQAALATGAQLWWATASAFRYTGDFPAEDYELIVRPSMSPPNLKEGFSGFFSPDHAQLIRTLKSVQRPLEELRPALGEEHAEYLRSLDAAYEAHACVCEVFVGGGHSLRTAQHSQGLSGGPAFVRHTLKPRAIIAAGGAEQSTNGLYTNGDAAGGSE